MGAGGSGDASDADALPGGELGVDPGEAVEERLTQLGVGAEQLGRDDEQTQQLVAGLGAAPEVGEEGGGLGEEARLDEGAGQGAEGLGTALGVRNGVGSGAGVSKGFSSRGVLSGRKGSS